MTLKATRAERETLDRLLGTVADAMHGDVLVLDTDTPETSPRAGWRRPACPAHRWSSTAASSGW